MATLTENQQVLKGGAFIIQRSLAEDTYTPSDITEEQAMFRESCREFVDKRVLPQVDAIDNKGYAIVVGLLEEAGELGLLGATLPEAYGGMGVSINTETMLSEEIGKSYSFGVAVAAHTGIGTLPVLYFGTEAQKAKYLPGMASGKLKASYCLTEPGSGSDALAAKTRADLNAEGTHYLLNGQKMWITNSGFADLFIVFAKIDGDKFTGFIVDGGTPGITLGAEEDKMGIKGSSTRQVFFENAAVPVENVLGEIGQGHKIAFNVLNIGRYKLCAMVTGGSKAACTAAVRYANERYQFGVPIASFGAIRHKMAEMACRIYAAESATYRTSGLIHQMITALEETGKPRYLAKLEAAEEYSIECAMLKVFGSEVLDYVVDEAVQIYGGMGFSEESPVARAYRDARINRIFEGTNEINRLLSVGMLLKKAMKGQLNLLGAATAVQQELMGMPDMSSPEGVLGLEKRTVEHAKKAVLMVAGAAAQTFMAKLEKEQEIMMNLADMLMEVFVCESTVLRTEKLIQAKGEAACSDQIDMTRVYLEEASYRIHQAGKSAICGFAEGDMLRMMLLGLKRYTKTEPYNTIAARRRIADRLTEANQYCY
ncbi:MAG: acyl-CoA dehydrogenase [Bacteroidetes bacterium]|nr:acyl-CoA dehydrogenase [Bacteroidota bacterium]